MTNTLSPTIDDERLNRIMAIESRGNPDARPPKGTAGGLGQFLAGTWDDEGKKHYPKQRSHFGKSWIGMRLGTATAAIQLLMLTRFTEGNAAALGKGWTDGDLYLAHFLGIGDARKFLRSDQSVAVAKIVSPKVIENNRSIMAGKTVGDVRAWAARSMRTRWDSLGQPNYVDKWFDQQKVDAFLAIGGEQKTDAEADAEADAGDDFTPVKPEDDLPPVPVPAPRPADAPPGVKGDPDVFVVQSMLKDMNYPPGGLDGRWGGMTAEAIAGFMNDRNMDGGTHPPTSPEEFSAIQDRLKVELQRAKAEGFVRPVAAERANPTDKKVKEIAPESTSVKRNSSIGLWGSLTTLAVGIWHAISDQVSAVWDFFTDNEDKIPDQVKDPNWLWEKFLQIPAGVWFIAVAALFGFIWFNSRSAVNKIVDDIKTGVRK